MELTREMFASQKGRRFGAANPERMRVPFWEWMVRQAENHREREERGEEHEPRPGELKRWPGTLRRHFGVDVDHTGGPVWTFDRYGTSRTTLPDGRVACIGGEHEDYYDPDFCIYNDVIILGPDGSVEIFGYPEDAFPPTDFHTATLVGDRIVVIGRLGYQGQRHPGTTPVMELDLGTLRFAPLPSIGDVPGWIFGHEAELVDGRIIIRGGKVIDPQSVKGEIRRNLDDFAYDLATGDWSRLTTRSWRQYTIADAGGKVLNAAFMKCDWGDASWQDSPEMADAAAVLANATKDLFLYIRPEALLPKVFDHEPPEDAAYSMEHQITISGVPVTIKLDVDAVDLLIEGDMPDGRADALVAEIRSNIESETGRPCTVTRLA